MGNPMVQQLVCLHKHQPLINYYNMLINKTQMYYSDFVLYQNVPPDSLPQRELSWQERAKMSQYRQIEKHRPDHKYISDISVDLKNRTRKILSTSNRIQQFKQRQSEIENYKIQKKRRLKNKLLSKANSCAQQIVLKQKQNLRADAKNKSVEEQQASQIKSYFKISRSTALTSDRKTPNVFNVDPFEFFKPQITKELDKKQTSPIFSKRNVSVYSIHSKPVSRKQRLSYDRIEREMIITNIANLKYLYGSNMLSKREEQEKHSYDIKPW